MKWDDLTMTQKNELMKIYIGNGVTSLDNMRSHFNSFATGGPTDPPKKQFRSPEEILQEEYNLEPQPADNTYYQQSPVETFNREASYKRLVNELSDRRRQQNYKGQAAKAQEFGTMDSPKSTGLQYAYRRLANSKGSELLYPIPIIGEAMFGVGIADNLKERQYADAALGLLSSAAMTYSPEVLSTANKVLKPTASKIYARDMLGLGRRGKATTKVPSDYSLANPQDYLSIQADRLNEPLSSYYSRVTEKPGRGWSSYSPDDNAIIMDYDASRALSPSFQGKPNTYMDNFTGAHEWIHAVNMHDRYPGTLRDMRRDVFETPGMDFSIRGLGENIDGVPEQSIINYFRDFGGTESFARTGQLFNFFGLRRGQKITPDMVKFAKKNYVNITGYDNNMQEWLDRIVNLEDFTRWANSNAGKLFSVPAVGALGYGILNTESDDLNK